MPDPWDIMVNAEKQRRGVVPKRFVPHNYVAGDYQVPVQSPVDAMQMALENLGSEGYGGDASLGQESAFLGMVIDAVKRGGLNADQQQAIKYMLDEGEGEWSAPEARELQMLLQSVSGPRKSNRRPGPNTSNRTLRGPYGTRR